MVKKDPDSTIFNCVIVSPDKTLFEGSVTKVTVPGIKQQLAILPDHTPIYAQLAQGTITTHQENSDSESFKIEGGVVRFRSNQATIITGFNVKEDVFPS